jgi:hypothetical protein
LGSIGLIVRKGLLVSDDNDLESLVFDEAVDQPKRIRRLDAGAFKIVKLRIPTMPAGYSDLIPATVPI